MNLFGQQKPKGRNPLAALMKPNLMEMLQPEEGAPEQEQPAQQPPMWRPPSRPPSRGQTIGDEAPPQMGPQNSKLYDLKPSDAFYANPFTAVPKALWDASGPHPSLDERKADVNATLKDLGISPPFAGESKYIGNEKKSDAPSASEVLASAKPGEQQDAPPGYGEPREPLPSADDQEKNLDLGMGGGLMSGALGATEGILQKYGKAAMTVQGAKNALKAEFQDTPELDQIISKTEAELAQTKANRKQPGVGEFIAMALMNLGGMHPRDSADMVLGLGDQKRDEMRLEDRLAQLEGGRASAKMQGRHELRGMERQDKYQNLQTALRQQEQGRKQQNEDREFGFKGQKLGTDKLMQELGQLRQQAGLATDPVQRKKLQDAIDRLDPFGQRQPQPQPRPKDDRQSRMFGDLISGGGYA